MRQQEHHSTCGRCRSCAAPVQRAGFSSQGTATLGGLVALLTFLACASSLPSSQAAEEMVRQAIDKGDQQRLRLTTFRKTDGKSMEFMGVSGYELMFEATAEFSTAVLFTREGVSAMSAITTSPVNDPPDRWVSQPETGFPFAMKGDRLNLKGTVSFERRESGWVPLRLAMSADHDATTRDMDTIRKTAENKRAAQEAARRREEERAAAEARAKASRDAERDRVAERFATLVRHRPDVSPYFGPRRGIYYIGRVSGNDTVLIEPTGGRYSMLELTVSGRDGGLGLPYNPGEKIPSGKIVGASSRFDTSDPIRFDVSTLPRHFPNESALRDVTVTFLRGEEDATIRVTILCIRGPNNPPCAQRVGQSATDTTDSLIPTNESNAVGFLRSVGSSQVAYSSNNGGAFATVSCLVAPATCGFPPQTTPFIDPSLMMTPERQGYRFSFIPGGPKKGSVDKGGLASFVYAAVPIELGRTGRRGFAVDGTGLICVTEDGTIPPTEGGRLARHCTPLR